MKILKTINSDIEAFNAGSSVCIGVFDGIHLGHQELIKRTIGYANENKISSVLFTLNHRQAIISVKASLNRG